MWPSPVNGAASRSHGCGGKRRHTAEARGRLGAGVCLQSAALLLPRPNAAPGRNVLRSVTAGPGASRRTPSISAHSFAALRIFVAAAPLGLTDLLPAKFAGRLLPVAHWNVLPIGCAHRMGGSGGAPCGASRREHVRGRNVVPTGD